MCLNAVELVSKKKIEKKGRRCGCCSIYAPLSPLENICTIGEKISVKTSRKGQNLLPSSKVKTNNTKPRKTHNGHNGRFDLVSQNLSKSTLFEEMIGQKLV